MLFKTLATLKKVLRPTGDASLLTDILFLVIFGVWIFVPVIILLFNRPDPNAYQCSGPGFVDFGCAGGWEAVIAVVLNVLFAIFLLSVFLVALIRLTNRGHK